VIRRGRDMKKGKHWMRIMGIVSVLLLFETPFIYGWELKEFLSPFHFFVSVEEEYNSNIYLTNKNTKDDFIRLFSG
jgi:hypothetical protein